MNAITKGKLNSQKGKSKNELVLKQIEDIMCIKKCSSEELEDICMKKKISLEMKELEDISMG